MSTYYHYDEELIGAGMQLGEIALYTGTKLDGLRGGPSECSPSNVFVYSREEEGVRDLDLRFWDNTLEVSAHEDHYIFLRNEQGDFIQQVSGPAKPVVVANLGAAAIRVDTPLGKFQVPAGAMFRLDQSAPLQRQNKRKVLLTFSDEAECKNGLESALILEGKRWKPLNVCVDNGLVKIKDGAFTIQTLTQSSSECFDTDLTLKDPPSDPDYEIYLRSKAIGFPIHFAGMGMKDEGLARVHHTFCLKRNEIYDFQRLRQAPAKALMRQCTACLPGLEELDGRSGNGQGEKAPAGWPALREPIESLPDGADISI